jgi:antibiotic biosynthesis monooxygenase (ABM) superfamily enzyme
LIAVIVGYKLKTGTDIQSILMKLRSHAMTYGGFIKAENLISTKDKTIAAIIYSWDKIEDWHIWENSSIRQEILHQADALLLEQPRITVYKVMPTTGWVHNILDD